MSTQTALKFSEWHRLTIRVLHFQSSVYIWLRVICCSAWEMCWSNQHQGKWRVCVDVLLLFFSVLLWSVSFTGCLCVFVPCVWWTHKCLRVFEKLPPNCQMPIRHFDTLTFDVSHLVLSDINKQTNTLFGWARQCVWHEIIVVDQWCVCVGLGFLWDFTISVNFWVNN